MREIDEKLFEFAKGTPLIYLSDLIQEGASINVLNSKNKTPLDIANKAGREDRFYELRKAGARLSKELKKENNFNYDFRSKLKDALAAYVLILASNNGIKKHYEKEKVDFSVLTDSQLYIYLSGFDISWDGDEQSILHCATQLRDYDIVEFLLKNGEDPNPSDIDSETPLDHAYQRGYDDIAKLIEQYGGKESADLK